MKRFLAMLLSFVMLVTSVPAFTVMAAETQDGYQFVLDTDGIDAGAEYIIASANAGEASALRFDPLAPWQAATQSVTITDNTIAAFEKDGYVTWTFAGTADTNTNHLYYGSVAAHNYYLCIQDSVHFDIDQKEWKFYHFGDGKYSIYTGGGDVSTLTYLGYADNAWKVSTAPGYSENVEASYESFVYLFKKVPYANAEYSVTYSANGGTSADGGAAKLPKTETGLKSGDVHTVKAPIDLKREEEGKVYIFEGWNTQPDGTGADYAPGELLKIEHYDVTLYAKWYLRYNHEVTISTMLDGNLTSLENILGRDVEVYIGLKGAEASSYIALNEVRPGEYVYQTSANGTYSIYYKFEDGTYQEMKGNQFVIYNQNKNLELHYYSVTYKASEEDDKTSWSEIFFAGDKVTVTNKVPEMTGFIFTNWKADDGDIWNSGDEIHHNITKPIVMVAQWVKAIDVTVNLVMNHKTDFGTNPDTTTEKEKVSIQLYKYADGINVPVENSEVSFDASHASHHYDEATNVTTYTHTYQGLPEGVYNVATNKSGYEEVYTRNENDLTIVFNYDNRDFDLTFDVKMADGTPKELYPKAVNVKVSYWGTNDNNELGWHIVNSQAGTLAPSEVVIDPNTGKGTASLTVWKHRKNDTSKAYEFRVQVVSYVMPDGTTVAAVEDTANPLKAYISETGLYTGNVTIEGGGRLPVYPTDSNGKTTDLLGAYYDGAKQAGIPTVTVTANPYTVKFHAGAGTIGEDKVAVLELTNQYVYPDLTKYVPVPNDKSMHFMGWDAVTNKDTVTGDGVAEENKAGQHLTGNIEYVAIWQTSIDVSGTVYVDWTYMGEPIEGSGDIATKAMIVLHKMVDGVGYTVASQEVTFQASAESKNYGEAAYALSIPYEAGTYRVRVLQLNYDTTYDNNDDDVFAANEDLFTVNNSGSYKVDAALKFVPDTYALMSHVNVSQIGAMYRPTSVEVKFKERNLGDSDAYQYIYEHEKNGLNVTFDTEGAGVGVQDVWKWHTDGHLYEYQLEVANVYGDDAIYGTDGRITYGQENAPFTVYYGISSWWDNVYETERNPLHATLVPNTYKVNFDLNLGTDSTDTTADIVGMEDYVTEATGSEAAYAYHHTWSHEASFMAFPYRAGYVFKGWKCDNPSVYVYQNGYITVAAGLAEDITLTAQWEKINDVAYAVRYLEKGTNRVLHGSKVVNDTAVGNTVNVTEEHIEINGYTWTSALINGKEIQVTTGSTITMVVDKNNANNLITLYYTADDGGHTEDVETNLHMDKEAILADDGTYNIQMEAFTTDSPITALVQQNTPLDIVLVLDQSGSISQSGYLDDLQAAINNFVTLIADHGRKNEIDHRIAMVGYAGDYDEPPTSKTDTVTYPLADKDTSNWYWVNTGVFDSNGDFHRYPVTGFNYQEYTGTPEANGTYYTKVTTTKKDNDGNDVNVDEYLLMMHHATYYHLISEEQAKDEIAKGTTVYGYTGTNADGTPIFSELTRNFSGLWLYGNNQLYSTKEFFTFHEDVWTHRSGMGQREIHGYGTGSDYKSADGHEGLYTRTDTTNANPQLNVYKDALNPVTVGAKGSGSVNPGLVKAKGNLGSNGGTFVQYGIEMANKIFEANPLPEGNPEGRVRILVTFTDGLPGIGTFDETVANEAIEEAYITKNTHGAYCYTIGLYPSNGVTSEEDVAIYMNAVSSNYPSAKSMDDVYNSSTIYLNAAGRTISDGKKYYVRTGSSYNTRYRELQYGTYTYNYWGSQRTGWYYSGTYSNTMVTTEYNAVVDSNGRIGDYDIFYLDAGYKNPENLERGYYATTDSEEGLRDYFSFIVTEITTKLTKEIYLHQDTILRDIMGQGLELAPEAVIRVYRQEGTYNTASGGIDWEVDASGNAVLEELASLTLPQNKTLAEGKTDNEVLKSSQIANWTDESGNSKSAPYIQVYNWYKQNTTDPKAADYHPHTVDVTGYDFSSWYINETKQTGYKLVVEISKIEAQDDVQWGRSTFTNNSESGLWLPADENGHRELLATFDQPNTIFIERTYVLDYAKSFTLSRWPLDKVEGKNNAGAIHVDVTLGNGMNQFDKANPTTSSAKTLTYGQLEINNGEAVYEPKTMNWNGIEQFYVFGETANQVIVSQDANEKQDADGNPLGIGNLWTKVEVIPANNVYYEDSFVTVPETNENNDKGVNGFNFTGNWQTVYSDTEAKAGQNTELPEHVEGDTYGNVHGWTDSLADDNKYTDGSAHMAGYQVDENGNLVYGEDEKPVVDRGASVEFTFTGTGVDVYTRTNDKSGIVVASIKRIIESVDENGTLVVSEETAKQKDKDGNLVNAKGIIMDNHAASGDYYQVPTISFMNLVYGTYKVKLVATSASATATGSARYEYYLDGIRVYNPLVVENTSEAYGKIYSAYEKENNAVFTEIRDVLLQYKDFNANMNDGTDGKSGAVFIDWVQKGQSGYEEDSVGESSYQIGIFEAYGPKNEVYLSSGQAIVLKVDPNNTYYVGLKSLNGDSVTAAYSGLASEATKITINHSTDLYYQVVPTDGYIVISNASEVSTSTDETGPILSITKLRTTNVTEAVVNNGIVPVSTNQALMAMSTFALRMAQPDTEEPDVSVEPEKPTEPEVTVEPEEPEKSDSVFKRINPVMQTEKYRDTLSDFWDNLFGGLRKVLRGEL